MDFHLAQSSYGQVGIQSRPSIIHKPSEYPIPTPSVKLEKDDSEEEIMNSGSSGSSANSPPVVTSPSEDSPAEFAAASSSPNQLPGTPTQNSPEPIVRVSPIGAPLGNSLSTPTTSAPIPQLPTPTPQTSMLPGNLAGNLAAMSTLFGSTFGGLNFADMATKSPEEQTQLSAELHSNLIQLVQAVATSVKAQQEEKARQEEAERAAREAAQIAEFIQHELTHDQRVEMSEFLSANPRVTVDDASILFTAKFSKQITTRIISTMKGEPLPPLPASPPKPQASAWPANVSHMVDMFKNQQNHSQSDSPVGSPLGGKMNQFKNRNSAFPEIEQKISELFDEAEADGRQLSSKFVRQKALEYADMLGIKNFNASKGWLLKLLARQNRKLGRSVDHLQKRKPFIRLSFGEKHEIAKYITQFPDKTYPEYARYFSELWNRTVTARQIITTKENTDKWLDEAYKGCEQTHYKFVDEGSAQDGPMVMKRKRSRVILTPDEREEISNFLADNSEMTFNQTAEIFARRWGKDVNRTHVASIMRLREKASQNTNSSNSAQLAIGGAPSMGYRKRASPPPSLLPQSHSHLQFQPHHHQSQLVKPRQLPMSGLELFNLHGKEQHSSPHKQSPLVVHGNGVHALNTSSSSSSASSLVKSERASSPVSVITPNQTFKREKPEDECFDVTDDAKKAKIQCEKCPAAFNSQANLFQHILSAPGHLEQ